VGLRTYLPLLRIVVRRVCDYINKHHDKIIENVGEGNAARVDAANDACAILVALLDTIIPEPS